MTWWMLLLSPPAWVLVGAAAHVLANGAQPAVTNPEEDEWYSAIW